MATTANTRARSRLRRGSLGAALLAVGLLSGQAHADARTEARKHFKTGMDLIARGSYDQGIAELERAHELLPHPNVLFNIARAHAEQGELGKAVEGYQRYLDTGPADADEVRQVVAQLQRRIERRNAALAAAQSTTGITGAAGATGTGDTNATPGASGAAGSSGASGQAPVRPVTGPAGEGPDGAAVGSEGAAVTGAARREDVFEEQVVTASRQAQSPLDAPNSTSIITAQDIRLSGLTKIQELLRRLAGVEVNIMTGGNTEVSIRGYNSRVSNKALVLVDYRSVYVDLLGTTFWEALPIDVEQIERIEVVRGPGSALYGANAFAGVINIITKRPGEGGSHVRAGVGSHGTLFGSATVSQRQGDTAYRVSAGYTREPKWSRDLSAGRLDTRTLVSDQNTASRNARFDLQVNQRLGRDVELSVGGGASKSFRNLLALGSLLDYDLDGWTADAEATLTTPHFNVRTFYTRLDFNAGLARGYRPQHLDPLPPRQNVFDVQAEVTERFKTGALLAHDVHVGATYRLKDVTWSYLDPKRENWVGFFGQDTLKIGKSVQVVASLRADYVPYLEQMVPSPRGSVIVKPTERSAVRLSGSTAFRAPSFVEAYVNLPVQAPSAPGAGALTDSSRRDLGGDARLKRERVVSVDLGYQNQQFEAVTFEVTGYYLQVKDLITLANTSPETLSTNRIAGLDPESGLMLAAFSGFTNQCLVYNTFGGEAGARVFPAEGLDVYVNYSLNLQRATRPAGCTDVENKQTSQHKVNAGFQFRTRPGFDGEVSVHYASSQLWSERVAPPATDTDTSLRTVTAPVSAYVLLNARLGYRFLRNRAEVSVTGFNLLNQQQQQHPFGQVIGRRFMGFLSYRF